MTRGRSSAQGAAAVFEADGTAGNLAAPVVGAFQPVQSRWVWQPLLPELWLHEQERHHLRETAHDLKEKTRRVRERNLKSRSSRMRTGRSAELELLLATTETGRTERRGHNHEPKEVS